jgi:hypothetical protein
MNFSYRRSLQWMEGAGAVVAAARRYRDLMRRYQRDQAELVAGGASLEDLVTTNWERFAETSAAEADLFASLDALDDGEREVRREA